MPPLGMGIPYPWPSLLRCLLLTESLVSETRIHNYKPGLAGKLYLISIEVRIWFLQALIHLLSHCVRLLLYLFFLFLEFLFQLNGCLVFVNLLILFYIYRLDIARFRCGVFYFAFIFCRLPKIWCMWFSKKKKKLVYVVKSKPLLVKIST